MVMSARFKRLNTTVLIVFVELQVITICLNKRNPICYVGSSQLESPLIKRKTCIKWYFSRERILLSKQIVFVWLECEMNLFYLKVYCCDVTKKNVSILDETIAFAI